jgi:molecular chaperone DnaK (HSP70)
MSQSMWDASVGDDSYSADNSSGLVIGLDFGSSNSSVAVWRADKNRVKIIRNKSQQGNYNEGPRE